MKKYVYIGAFGFLGAIARFAVKQIDFSAIFQYFPINTFLINMLGSFLFSFIVTFAAETGKVDHNLRLGLTAGFLGTFTTFATLCRDAVTLVQSGRTAEMLVYIAASLGGGLLAVWGGAVLVRSRVLKLLKAPDLSDGKARDETTGDSEH
ncbi:CrcB protein [Sporobacter termitidis DSM 10068]|uniref:Fluoride-specific ion channel FluC n=1 Tax=Sporobacter termitidis DSM 10068 TaxID=1123282 RepID=A0A1M5YWW9_9FIRM|nr:CrcB family protein [Sporobacter termitidis]SHI16552.1 CrcB protein [Sporobacter termitidis DSM 10068]